MPNLKTDVSNFRIVDITKEGSGFIKIIYGSTLPQHCLFVPGCLLTEMYGTDPVAMYSSTWHTEKF